MGYYITMIIIPVTTPNNKIIIAFNQWPGEWNKYEYGRQKSMSSNIKYLIGW